MSDSNHSGRLDYPNDGFVVSWDEHGVRVQVTDYHADVLHLPWETVLDLAQRARPSAVGVPRIQWTPCRCGV